MVTITVMYHDPIRGSREPQQEATNQVQRIQLRGESGDVYQQRAYSMQLFHIDVIRRHGSFCKCTYWQHEATGCFYAYYRSTIISRIQPGVLLTAQILSTS
jgi:hypothetical protein